jgi:hypothetical protein
MWYVNKLWFLLSGNTWNTKILGSTSKRHLFQSAQIIGEARMQHPPSQQQTLPKPTVGIQEHSQIGSQDMMIQCPFSQNQTHPRSADDVSGISASFSESNAERLV